MSPSVGSCRNSYFSSRLSAHPACYQMADPESEENVFTFEDEQPVSDSVHQYTDVLRNDKAAIIIDNGSYKCRAGWVTDDQPRLIFKNVLARQRSKKDADVLIGNDISNLEVVRWQLKTQFDRGVVTQYDIQEQVFDYVFTHLGIDTVSCIDHPIVLTEPLCNPNYCRQQMSELLFECYHVPSILFGIDAMFSLQDSQSDKAPLDSLVVSCGYHTTHVMPILGGRLQADRSRRINIGGHHMDIFMQRLLQLKYPSHFAALTLSRAEELMHRHMYMSLDYNAELTQWAQEDYFFSNVHKMQLPYTTPPTGISQTAEQQKERREQQGRRLKDLNAKRRDAKLAAEQERLQQLLNLDEMGEEEGEGDEFQKSLSTFGYMSQGELQTAIMKLNDSILRMRQKIEAGDGEGKTDQSGELSSVSSDPKSADLTAVVKRQDIDYRPPGTTMEDWLAGIRKRRQDIISSRIERRQRRSEMTKRRTLASQQRMKIITALAQGTKRKKEDTFGQNDDDWNIYKEISKDAGNSDSEAEQEQLDELEMVLREHDPEFIDPNQQEAMTFDIAEYYKLYIGIERIRVPELLLQPSMVGVEQAGLTDTIDFILHKFSADEQRRLVQNVFLTGGCSSIPFLKERIECDLRAIRPFQSTFAVHVARDPVLGAWHGAKQMAQSAAFGACCINRTDYDEMGGEYIKEHFASNRYARTPILVAEAM